MCWISQARIQPTVSSILYTTYIHTHAPPSFFATMGFLRAAANFILQRIPKLVYFLPTSLAFSWEKFGVSKPRDQGHVGQNLHPVSWSIKNIELPRKEVALFRTRCRKKKLIFLIEPSFFAPAHAPIASSTRLFTTSSCPSARNQETPLSFVTRGFS